MKLEEEKMFWFQVGRLSSEGYKELREGLMRFMSMSGHALRCTIISLPLLASSCLPQVIKQIFCSSQEVFGFAWLKEAPAVYMRKCHQPLITYKEDLVTFKMLLVSLPH